MSDSIDPSTTAAMHRDLADLRHQIASLTDMQAAGRRWTLATIVIVVALFALFSYATYSRIRHNFDDAAIRQAVNQHGDEIMPIASKMLMATGSNVMPVYRDEIVRTVRAQGPEAATAAVGRLKGVPEQSGKVFQQKMQAAFDAAVKQVEPDFKAAYPHVADERRQQLMQSFVMEQIAAQNKQVAVRVDQLYQNDLGRMQSTLEKFDLPDAGHEGSEGLERRFLHTMVALLDDQVDAAYPVTALPATNGPGRPTAMKAAPTTAPTTMPMVP